MPSPSAARTAPPIRPPQGRRQRSGDRSLADGARPQLRSVAGRRSLRQVLLRELRRRGPGDGHDSAGRILLVMVLGLALAALVNADALVERAERKPLGAGRDRALAIWHPVQDVAHVLQLHRLRHLGDAIAGDDGDGEAAAAPATPTERRIDIDAPPRRPELRTPTAAAPLRLWVGGDSMVRDLSESVQRLTADDTLFTTTVHYEISSGLTRPDFFNWPAMLVADMTDTDAEAVIIMFGANDGQGLIAADGTTFQQVSDAGWQREYATRVAAVMDQLRADGRLVYWLLQPPMRDGDFDARMDIINDLYRAAAEGRPWVELVETAPLFGDADGQFADRLPGPDGDLEDLRQDDGIHFSREGADTLANFVLDLIDDEIDRPAATTASTTPPSTTSTTDAG